MYYSVQKQTFKTRNRCHRGRKDSRTSGRLWFCSFPPGHGLRPCLRTVWPPGGSAARSPQALDLHSLRPCPDARTLGRGLAATGTHRRALGCSRTGQSQLPGPPFYGQFRRVLSRAPLGRIGDKGRTEAHARRPPRWAGTPWANPRSNRWPTSSNRWPLSPARPPWPSKALPAGLHPIFTL